jgi:DNA-binding response OmpR family regulator
VVEDGDDARASLHQLFSFWGYEVRSAADGPEGVRQALAWRPGAAVVDIGLPGFDGFEVCRRVRAALGGGVRLIALTAYDGVQFRARASAAGFDHYVTKPADLEDLRRLVGGLTA